MQEKSLIVIKKGGIFEKIKKFLKGLFIKEEIIMQEVNNEPKENVPELKQKFRQEIIFDTKEQLRILQHQLKTKQIQISNLTEKQKDDLIELYNEQIKMKKERLVGLYKRIEKLKKMKENI